MTVYMAAIRRAGGVLLHPSRWQLWSLGAWCVAWMLATETGVAVWLLAGNWDSTWPEHSWDHFTMLAIAAMLYMLATRTSEERRRATDLLENEPEHIDQNSAFVYGGMLLLPAPLAIILLTLIRAMRWPIARKPPSRFLFTSAGIAFALLAARTLVAHTALGTWLAAPTFDLDQTGAAEIISVGAAAIAVCFLGETVVIGLGRALVRGADGRAAGLGVFTFRRGTDGQLVSVALGTVKDNRFFVRTLGLAVVVAAATLPLHGLLLVVVVAPIIIGDTRREQRWQESRIAGEQHKINSHTDLRTGLPNEAGFAREAGYLLSMDRAWGRPTTVALLDIDLFKGVNDTHGHHAGDEVLRVLATRFRPSTANTPNEHSVVRTEDLIGRTGGDEFTAILPGTSPQEAAIILERVRAVIADDVVVHTTDAAGGGAVEVRVSLSIGVAEVRPDQSLAEAIKDADVAAYASKRAGRNRVTLAGASIEPDIPASREEAAGGDQVPVMDKYRSTTPEQSTPAAGEQVAARR